MTFPSLCSLFETQVNSFSTTGESPNLKTIEILKNSVKSAKMSKKHPDDEQDGNARAKKGTFKKRNNQI